MSHAAEWDGPIVVHVLTQKGRGYAPAEEDEVQRLHDVKAVRLAVPGGSGTTERIPPATYTDAFTTALLRAAERRPEVVALTAAMPGPTGLLAFQARHPDRCFDVGIAEQHEVTAAAGMAMGGLRPVVAVYSTFFSRAFDQANLDVGLHHLPVVFVLDRAGITGDDGPSHHGVLDLAQALSIPGLTVFAPSSAEEIDDMLETALSLPGPSCIRFPKTPARHVPIDEVGHALRARRLRAGDTAVCLVGVGKLLAPCLEAAEQLAELGVEATVWDPRVLAPWDPELLEDALSHGLVVSAEDGVRIGGAGSHLGDALNRLALERGSLAPPVINLGVPKSYLAQGRADDILAGLGLDAAGIASSVQQFLRAERHRAEQVWHAETPAERS